MHYSYVYFTERVQQIVRGFNNDWKRALEMINGEVMRAFTNFKNGTQILQVDRYTIVYCYFILILISRGNLLFEDQGYTHYLLCKALGDIC